MALYKESDNSDDPALRKQVDASGDKLKAAITPFVGKVFIFYFSILNPNRMLRFVLLHITCFQKKKSSNQGVD